MPARPLPVRSKATAHAPAPVAQGPAMAEIAEFAARAPHLDFRTARARILVDALRAACKLADPASPATHC